MCKRKNTGYKYPKPNLFLITAAITAVIEVKEYTNSVKTVFECVTAGETKILCVYWAKPDINPGDTVTLKGWFKQEVFIAESLLIIKKKGTKTRSRGKAGMA